MPNRTQTERIAVIEEQIKEMKTAMTQGFSESKGFHTELLAKLDQSLVNNNLVAIEIATLKEKIRTQEKIIWTALGAGIAGFIGTLWQIITK